MKLFFLSKRNSAGYTIVELFFYISLFTVLSVVVINAMITMSQSFRETSVQGEFIEAGNIMEKISREIRGAISVSSISNTDLVLNTKDSSGVSKTVEFLVSGNNLQFLDNGSLVGNLNTGNIIVSGTSFTGITTAQGYAIKVSFAVSSVNDSRNRTVTFNDTIVLRGSY